MAGRKSKWETHILPNLDKIKEWKLQGYNEKQIVKLLGIAKSTFEKYKVEESVLSDLLKETKEELIGKLEKSLFQKALGGYKTKKVKIKTRNARDGSQVEESKEIEEVTHAPDTTALIFSLKNLAPDRWQDKREVVNNVNMQQKELMEGIKDLTDTLSDNNET